MDLDKNCYMVHHGFTIEVNGGNLSLCCMDNTLKRTSNRAMSVTNLRDVDDLQEWWAEEYKKVWKIYEDGEQGSVNPCWSCFGEEGFAPGQKRRKDTVFQSYRNNLKKGKIKWRYEKGGENKVRFIELAASNICNQMCVMCSGRHSSLWFQYDTIFDHEKSELFRFTEEDYQKILKLIPDLDILFIKGGDCFADQKHMDLIEEVSKQNPECLLKITTNLQGLRKSHLPFLSKLKNTDMMVSVDGIHEMYNWIRGGDFDKVEKNMEMYHRETGNQIGITITVSVYNFWALENILAYFAHKPYVRWMQCHNIVTYPNWCSPSFLPEEVIEKQLVKYLPMEFKYSNKTSFKNFFDPLNRHEPENYKNWLYNVWNYTNKMNKIRGFDILDHVPELKNELRKL